MAKPHSSGSRSTFEIQLVFVLSSLELQNGCLGIRPRCTVGQVGLLQIAAADGSHRVLHALRGESQICGEGKNLRCRGELLGAIHATLQTHAYSCHREDRAARRSQEAGVWGREAQNRSQQECLQKLPRTTQAVNADLANQTRITGRQQQKRQHVLLMEDTTIQRKVNTNAEFSKPHEEMA